MMTVGLIMIVVGGFLALMFLFATVLAANSCVAFGGAFDDYGTTSTDFFVILALTFVAVAAFTIGVVLLIKGFSLRNRHADCA